MKTNDPAHTPTPWTITSKNAIYGKYPEPQFVADCGDSVAGDANAAFIVRACNSQELQINTLREVEQLITRESDDLGFHLKVVPMKIELVQVIRSIIAPA